MGSKWEVYGYWYKNTGHWQDDYEWFMLYQGDSTIKALWYSFRNRKKYGCIKIELRH